MNKREKARQALFQQGADALAAARPKAPRGYYACPICLIGYPSVDAFSLEDVPPKSIGGRPLLLTCKTCNSRAGHEIDVHIHEAAKEAEIASGSRPQQVRLSALGETITANVRVEDGNLDISGVENRSDPRAFASLFRELAGVSEAGSSDARFTITYKTRHDAHREAIAWLKVGYLYAFSVLGYNYILRPELEVVRSQIRSPKDDLASSLVRRFGESPGEDGVHFVFNPPEFRCLAVRYGDRFVVLPDFEASSTFEERILHLPKDQWPQTMVGKQLPLPRKPVYLLDFRPSLLRHLSPEFAD